MGYPSNQELVKIKLLNIVVLTVDLRTRRLFFYGTHCESIGGGSLIGTIMLHVQVLRNSGVSKRAKSSLFNHYALKQLSALLSRPAVEGGEGGERRGRGEEGFQLLSRESGEVVSLSLHDYVLEVLSGLCTSFQHGVCYRTKTDSLLSKKCAIPPYIHSHRHLPNIHVNTQTHTPTSKWIENIEFLINVSMYVVCRN